MKQFLVTLLEFSLILTVVYFSLESYSRNTWAKDAKLVTDLQQVEVIEGIGIYKEQQLEVPDEVLVGLRALINDLPDYYKRNPVESINLVQDNDQGRGGFFVFPTRDIYMTDKVFTMLTDQRRDWINHVILHEWMHYIDYQHRYSYPVIESMPLIYPWEGESSFTSKFTMDFAYSVGWTYLYPSALYMRMIPGKSPEFTMQSSYGQSVPTEDIAETASYFFMGQSQLLSEARIKWLEKVSASEAEEYMHCQIPYPSFNKRSISDENLLQAGLQESYLKFSADYKYATRSVSLGLSDYKKFRQELLERGFELKGSERLLNGLVLNKYSCDDNEYVFINFERSEGEAWLIVFSGASKPFFLPDFEEIPSIDWNMDLPDLQLDFPEINPEFNIAPINWEGR